LEIAATRESLASADSADRSRHAPRDGAHHAERDAYNSGNGSSGNNGIAVAEADVAPVKRTQRRRSTSHLKDVPDTLKLREEIKAAAERLAAMCPQPQQFSKDELESLGRRLLQQMDLPEKYLGFTMVLIGNYFWKRQLMAIPFERRMLLLPHCLKHAEGCPADYDEFGLDCEKCGACSIADYKVRAEQLGYKVLVAEGSPIVLKIIVEGYVDGIVGVACLNVLEKAIDKILLAGVPSFAIPLHSGDCKNTSLDEHWVWEVLEKYEPLQEPASNSYVPLMRAANALFKDDFDRLLPRLRSKTPEQARAPLGRTEEVAYDWLINGGKRFRPFITLAAYAAVAGGRDVLKTTGSGDVVRFSDSVSRVAMAIEAFHKASLVHDDIQDDDLFRYGRQTLHRSEGLGPAINIGDYLIGLGYRLIHSCAPALGSDIACDILDSMAGAHLRLCDGQGAEMAWQNKPDWSLTPLDALQIYALKTSPAFEAALYAGLRMAGPIEPYKEVIPAFCRQVGVGFQILNDLKDWSGDDHNKLVAGQDALALRPTLLLALALQGADETQRGELQGLFQSDEHDRVRLARLKQLFRICGAFENAEALVDKSRERAEALADGIQPDELRRLFYFLIDTVLAEEEAPPPLADGSLLSLPIVPATGV
jgi:geranylgeranyl pyrophosphate synthase